jgi:DNA-binding transcriptional ArsR family regulator
VTASALDRTFAALADPTRRRVVDLLRRGPQRAGDLAAALSTSPPAMSRHLRVLRQTGLVGEEGLDEDARVRVYRLRPERFAAIRDWLDEVEDYWEGQLAAFKDQAERGVRPGSPGPRRGAAAPATQPLPKPPGRRSRA